MDKKSRFLKVYANLPLGAREEIIVVVSGEPLSWKSAKLEVEQETSKGKEILETLTKLKILV
jgi:hypothetical protein